MDSQQRRDIDNGTPQEVDPVTRMDRQGLRKRCRELEKALVKTAEAMRSLQFQVHTLTKVAKLAEGMNESMKALEEFVYEIEGFLPERNCSCHKDPPCQQCAEWGHFYEAVVTVKQALEVKP